MSDSNRTVTASTKVTDDMAAFLDQQANQLETTQSELLRRLATHYRDACNAGLSCPHCKNDVEINL